MDGVRVDKVSAVPTAVVRTRTTGADFPAQWRGMLDEVWAVMGRAGLRAGRNVMLYRDVPDGMDVEVGVETTGEWTASGRVVSSELPAGTIATVRSGPPADIGGAHTEVREWCQQHGAEILGTRWEIYGHVAPGTSDFDVTVSYLLTRAPTE